VAHHALKSPSLTLDACDAGVVDIGTRLDILEQVYDVIVYRRMEHAYETWREEHGEQAKQFEIAKRYVCSMAGTLERAVSNGAC